MKAEQLKIGKYILYSKYSYKLQNIQKDFFTRNIFSNLMISFSGLLVLLFSGFPEAECATQEFHLKAINRTALFNLGEVFSSDF